GSPRSVLSLPFTPAPCGGGVSGRVPVRPGTRIGSVSGRFWASDRGRTLVVERCLDLRHARLSGHQEEVREFRIGISPGAPYLIAALATPPRVLLVVAHPVIASGIETLLQLEGEYDVRRVASVAEAVQSREWGPQVAL